LSDKIQKNIARAYAEESKGADRIAAFVLQAEKEGYPHLARLFRAVSNAKSVHSRRFRILLRGKIGETRENLEEAVRGEIRAVEEAYPAMVEEAREGTKAVKKAFIQSRETDNEHALLLKQAMDAVKVDQEHTYYVCRICGHIHLDEIPENCPICNAVPGRFERVV
jgi:rubrerythrin